MRRSVSTLEKAIGIAAQAHAGQVDKAGSPYILHPLRVMLGVASLEERIVAVLHDVVEDTDWTFDRLRIEGFAEPILEALDAVTRREGESYEDFVQRAAKNPIGRIVKRADILDNLNLSRIPDPTPSDHDRVARYRKALSLLDSA